MARRAGSYFLYFAVLAISVLFNACSGTPPALTTTPAITTTSLPGGSTSSAYSATVTTSGGTAPFTWSVASGTLPTGLSLGSSTSSSVTIAGTPTAQGTFTFTISVTDSTGASATSASLTIRISNLAITPSSPLPSGTAGTAYSLQFQATGGTAPYQWSVASGSTLPTGLTLSGTGLLSGTPTVQKTYTFGITVTDSESPTASLTEAFSLTISGATGLALLQGNFAFEFRGFNSSGQVVAAGSFVADGSGNITGGVEDINSIQGPPKNQVFTGTYTLGSDNRGTLIFSSLSGTPTYAVSIDSTGAQGRLIEFDSSGTRGSGQLVKQSVTTCGGDTISGTISEAYAWGVTGSAAAFSGVSISGPVVLAGAFTATPPPAVGQSGSLTGEADINIPGINIPNPVNTTAAPPLSGTFKTTSRAGVCTMTLTPQQTSSGLTFDVYPVSGTTTNLSTAFIVETDAVSSAAPYVTAGEIYQQCILTGDVCSTSPFTSVTAGTFFTAGSVGALTGQVLDTQTTPNTYLPDVAVAQLAGSGGSTFTMSVVENQAGTIATYGSPFQALFDTLDTEGRVSTNLASPFGPVFYIINQNEALCIGQINNNPFFGIFQPQSTGPFTASTIKGTFAEGTLHPSTSAVEDFSGVVTLDGTSAVIGTQDTSTSSANIAAQTVTGTYSNISSSIGSGTLTLTSPAIFTGSFFVVSSTEIEMVSTTAGNLDPVLVILGP